MRILICGDRDWINKKLIKETLEKVKESLLKDGDVITVVIEGECRGADIMGRECAEELKIPVMKFPADWKRFPKAAGPIRNKQMLVEGKPDLILAFHNNIQNSKGTKNMIEISSKAGIKVILVGE